MKTLVKIFFLVAVISLVAGCNKTDDKTFNNSSEMKSGETHKVTVPFKADFIGVYDFEKFRFGEDADCQLGYECRVFDDFEGNATHLGNFYGTFEFCACGPDDENIEGPDEMYGPADVWLIAANRDKLHVTLQGSVRIGRLDYHPDDVNSYWIDPFEIIGGTGRFEGASGGGWTDDYNRDSYPANSFHHWTGTITMVKGKKN